ncbi:MAG: hypothetical protein QOE97_3797 [Pseudonocardiales bacterium]|jgi:hypothetical protein|nr:hypothetical protein [Pseudonocardiales bacterium]
MTRSTPAHAPRVPFALLVGGLVVGGLCALLALNTASAANELSRHDLAAKDAAIAAQVQQLQNQVAASAAPGNLGQAAAALGMVPAGNPAFLRIGTNGAVTVLGSPAPATANPLTAASPPATRRTTPTAHPAASRTATPATVSPRAKSTTSSTKPTKPTNPVKPTKPTEPAITPTPTTTLGGGAR